MPYTIPTQAQARAIIRAHARAVGAVNVRVSEVMLSIDVAYPNIPTAEFEVLRDSVVRPEVGKVVSAGLNAIWS